MKNLFNLATGLFTGTTLSGGDEFIAANIPAGCGVVSGTVDPQRQRVDLATGDLVDWQPPTIADAAQVAQVRADRDRRLAATDWVVLRAIDSGVPTDAAWTAYRQALRDVPEQPGFPTAITWPQEPSA